MPFSNFLANEILDDVFSGNAYTRQGHSTLPYTLSHRLRQVAEQN